MDSEIVTKIANMCVKLNMGEEFYFTICEKDNKEVEYNIGVKLIEEFSSLLLLIGSCGGGFNYVFPASDNIVDRNPCLMNWIIEDFLKELSEYEFVGIEIEHMTNLKDFRDNSLFITAIDSDGIVITRAYDTVNNFLNYINSENKKIASTAPMLDDKISRISINDIKVNSCNFRTLNDFYKELNKISI